MRKKMLVFVRQQVGLGKSFKFYYINRVECVNSFLSSEMDYVEFMVDVFVVKMRVLIER